MAVSSSASGAPLLTGKDNMEELRDARNTNTIITFGYIFGGHNCIQSNRIMATELYHLGGHFAGPFVLRKILCNSGMISCVGIMFLNYIHLYY